MWIKRKNSPDVNLDNIRSITEGSWENEPTLFFENSEGSDAMYHFETREELTAYHEKLQDLIEMDEVYEKDEETIKL
jgi:hypothetical protein